MPAPAYKSVMEDQLSGGKKNTKAGTVEKESKTLSQRKTLSTGSAQMEMKPVTAGVEKSEQ